jgi:hypothetical protein
MPGTLRYNLPGDLFEDFKGKSGCRCSRIDAVPAANLDLLAAVTFAVAYARNTVS